MLSAIAIHRLSINNKNQYLSCADINGGTGQIVCGTDQGPIYQSSTSNDSTYTQLLGHTKLVSDVCYYDANGSFILSCSADTSICLWRSSSSNCVTLYRAHLCPIWCIGIHRDSDRFASGSMDASVRLWTPERIDTLRTLVYHSSDVNTVVFHPNGKYLASGANDGLVVLWAVEQAEPARILKSSSTISSIEQLAFTADGNFLLSISHDNSQMSDIVSIWDIRSAKENCLVKNIPGQRRLIKPCQIQNTTTFVTGFENNLIFTDINDQRHYRADICVKEKKLSRLLHLKSIESNKLLAITE